MSETSVVALLSLLVFESILEDDDEEWDEDEDVDYINDEDNLISFLNEYYVVYPKKIPKAEYK